MDRIAAAFDEHAPGLWRYLARQAGAAVAEDLVAETFLAAWQQRSDYAAERGSLRAWLYGIATNLLRRHHRTQAQQSRMTERLSGRRPDAEDGHDHRIAERLDARTHLKQLEAAIAALPAADREVLLLSSLAGLDHREIAAALGIPEGTVRSRMHRVRRTLRATLPAAKGEQ
ncbi:sigma-70 family RNA polymerase sigma factor [Actinoplanes sp. NPDC026619]|uniref:RNA polymerase sigma factor n=1 Tax=Actinoplanes sp. NPDC026619 TaxID=3155798 RepID=UPI0033CA3198